MARIGLRRCVALELFLISPWTEQLAKRQFQFGTKIASEQCWSSIVGHRACTISWQANRKRGRPLAKWNDKLSNIRKQHFPLHHGWLAAAKLPFWQNALHILWPSRPSFFPTSLWDRSRSVSHWLGRARSKQKVSFPTKGAARLSASRSLHPVAQLPRQETTPSSLRLCERHSQPMHPYTSFTTQVTKRKHTTRDTSNTNLHWCSELVGHLTRATFFF